MNLKFILYNKKPFSSALFYNKKSSIPFVLSWMKENINSSHYFFLLKTKLIKFLRYGNSTFEPRLKLRLGTINCNNFFLLKWNSFSRSLIVPFIFKILNKCSWRSLWNTLNKNRIVIKRKILRQNSWTF